MRNRVLIILLGVILLLSVAGCGAKSQQPSGEDERLAMTIQTDCGDLLYPAEWEEFVTTAEEKTGYGTSVTFATENDGEQLELFTLNIGGGDGDEVGTLTDSTGTKRTVKMVISELTLEGVDAETANRLFAMQEDINYIVEHLQ